MTGKEAHTDIVLRITRERGVARARDFRAAGVPPSMITRLCEQGRLIRRGRGLYQHPDFKDFHAAHDLAEIATMVPTGVVCLLTALRIHGLTTQLPHAVWLAMPIKARVPRNMPISHEIVWMSEPALSAGRTITRIEGVNVPIHDAAKTVVDCFKFRRRVGLDVAIEALRDALRERKATRKQLWHYAGICRVRSVMRPYLEALA